MCDFPHLNEREKGILKIDVTVEYAEMYGLTYAETARFFRDHEVYDYLNLHGDLLATNMCGWIAEIVAREFGVPGPQERS